MEKNARRLSDGELLEALDRLAMEHRELVAKMVEHLAEVERRRLHLEYGYGSLYTYATKRLKLSKHEAYLRITAARAATRNEEILPGLEKGELSLSTVKAVAPHLEAHPELLAKAMGRTKRQVERLVAEKTGNRKVQNELRARPVAGGRVELSMVVSEETANLLEEALDLMSHESPKRDPEPTLAKALGLLVAKKKKPRGSVPAAAERAVQGERRCAFVGKGGRSCGETRFVELDHDTPRAAGGSDEPENLRWLCRPHNEYEAERRLGQERVTGQRKRAMLERETTRALRQLGFGKSESARAAGSAVRQARELDLAVVLRSALTSMPLGGVLHTRASSPQTGRHRPEDVTNHESS